MIEINPNDRSGKQPSDWRYAWDAFTALKRVARAIGEPTGSWKLEAPSGIGKGLRQWKMTYSFKGTSMNAFMGTNGRQTAEAIKQLLKGYEAVLEGHRAEQRARKPLTGPSKQDPRTDPFIIQKMRELWDQGMRSKSTQEWEQFKEAHPEVIRFMGSRAGYLPITMRQYIYNHPHGQRWPIPPQDERQLRERQYALEKEIRDKERSRTNDRS